MTDRTDCADRADGPAPTRQLRDLFPARGPLHLHLDYGRAELATLAAYSRQDVVRSRFLAGLGEDASGHER